MNIESMARRNGDGRAGIPFAVQNLAGCLHDLRYGTADGFLSRAAVIIAGRIARCRLGGTAEKSCHEGRLEERPCMIRIFFG